MGQVDVPRMGGEERPLLTIKMGFEFDAKDKYSEPTAYTINSCYTALPDNFDIVGKKFRLFVGALKPGSSPFTTTSGNNQYARNCLSASIEDTEIAGETFLTYERSSATFGYVRFSGEFSASIYMEDGRTRCIRVDCPCREWATNNAIRYMNMMARLEIYE